MDDEKVKKLQKHAESLFNDTERSNFENQWRSIIHYLMPSQRGYFNESNDSPGENKNSKVYTSFPITTNQTLAAILHNALTNPLNSWARIQPNSEDLLKDRETRDFFERASEKLSILLNESNFHDEMEKNYQFYTSLGNMILSQTVKERKGRFDGFFFEAWHLAECVYSLDDHHKIDSFYRRFKMNHAQMIEKFGTEAFSSEFLRSAESRPYEKKNIIHAIFRRDAADVNLNEFGLAPPASRPIHSVYFCPTFMDGEKVLAEQGFYELPVSICRFMVSPNENYGRGPGNTVISDVRALNKYHELTLIQQGRAASPPVLTTQRDLFNAPSIPAGSILFSRNISPDAFRELTPTVPTQMLEYYFEEYKSAIKRAFFIDQLTLPSRDSTGEMTAYETQERKSQSQMILGPLTTRVNTEFLSPIVERSFNIALRAGVFGDMTAAMKSHPDGKRIRVKFINEMTRSQQLNELNNLSSFFQEAANMAQADPLVLDNIDFDSMTKEYAKTRGLDHIVLKSQKQVIELRKERAQQEKQQQAVETATKQADIHSKMQPTNTGNNFNQWGTDING